MLTEEVVGWSDPVVLGLLDSFELPCWENFISSFRGQEIGRSPKQYLWSWGHFRWCRSWWDLWALVLVPGCLLLRLRDRSNFKSLSHFSLSWDVDAGRALELSAFWSTTSIQIISGFMPKEESCFCDSEIAFPGLRSSTLCLKETKVPCDLQQEFFPF